MNIKFNFSENLVKKIIGNNENKKEYLILFNKYNDIGLEFTKITRGKNKGCYDLKYDTKNLNKTIVDTWDYEISKKVIREMFYKSKKYQRGKEADEVMEILIKEWNRLNLGSVEWPFSQGDFDNFVQRINAENSDGIAKDNKVKQAAVKFRRLKEINTVRNDFIETLIFEKNENILPTLNHSRGVDFYIDGESFDQKVAKSPTNEFKKNYGDNWKEIAIQNPELVAEYLYKFQDEGRFGADSRLLVVYLDENLTIENIKERINSLNLENPLEISFTYSHKVSSTQKDEKRYKVRCFVILLSN